jgi:hypothetical protein
MAIKSIDDMIAGMRPAEEFTKNSNTTLEAVGVFHSLWYGAGRPSPANVPAAGLAGEALVSPVVGQIPFPVSLAGKETRLAGLECQSNVGGTCILADRLWQNSGINVTTTTEQLISSVAFPARDRNGEPFGDGLQIGIEVSASTTNGGSFSNMTLNYTNNKGVAGRLGTMPSFPQTATAGTIVPFVLDAGDTGVQSIQGLTLGTSLVTGTVNLVAYRTLARVSLLATNTSYFKDALQVGFPRMFDNSVPFLIWVANNTNQFNVIGQLLYTQG